MKIDGMELEIDGAALLEAFFVPLYETSVVAAQRMEQEAKMTLQEQTHGPKTSGALMESIQGFVTALPGHGIVVGVKASAIETGQWERSQGEPEEADRTAGKGRFNYAEAVEQGTGIYGPQKQAIVPKSGDYMRFWTGEYYGKNDIVYTKAVLGQPGKHFLERATLTAMPFLEDLFNNVGLNINITRFVK